MSNFNMALGTALDTQYVDTPRIASCVCFSLFFRKVIG